MADSSNEPTDLEINQRLKTALRGAWTRHKWQQERIKKILLKHQLLKAKEMVEKEPD